MRAAELVEAHSPFRRRLRVPSADTDERDAVQLLAGTGCPVCRAAEEAERRWFTWFVLESSGVSEVRETLRLCVGFCPGHTRAVFATEGGADAYQDVELELVPEAIARSRGDGSIGECLACWSRNWASNHASMLLVRAMRLGRVSQRVEEVGGLCLPHTLGLLQSRRGSAAARVRVAGAFAGGMARAPAEDVISRLTGADPDARRRGRILAGTRLPDRRALGRDWLLALLEMDGCPICLSQLDAARGFLQWLPTGFRVEHHERKLCHRHLAELATLDDEAGPQLARLLAHEWASALNDYVRSASAPAIRPWRDPGGWLEERLVRRSALPKLLLERACSACDVERIAEKRTTALVLAGLEDRGVARVYEERHGICLRHLLAMPAAARDGAPGERLRAQLALAGWQIEEAARKHAWSARWEEDGDEANAARRFPQLVDGRARLEPLGSGAPPVESGAAGGSGGAATGGQP